MCGIVGYIGKRNTIEAGLDCLKQLEYRGYDSAGVAFVDARSGKVTACKAVGPIRNLDEYIKSAWTSRLAIYHTRWATHGNVTEANAHPHTDCTKRIWLAHNGIIENYQELKTKLIKQKHNFYSDTDTEVIAHLIEEIKKKKRCRFEEATRLALQEIRGTYGLVAFDVRQPHMLIAARNFSPLLLGVGENEYIVASDASAIMKRTARVIYLDDGEIAILTPKQYSIYDFSRKKQKKPLQRIEWSPEAIKKGGHPHFMKKEISEEPEAITNSLRGRLVKEDGLVKLGGLSPVTEKLRGARRVIISACGTAYFAGCVGKYCLKNMRAYPRKWILLQSFAIENRYFARAMFFLPSHNPARPPIHSRLCAKQKRRGCSRWVL
jgi:glutamine---fructose-6-phosphate transaminase (isomerizing)